MFRRRLLAFAGLSLLIPVAANAQNSANYPYNPSSDYGSPHASSAAPSGGDDFLGIPAGEITAGIKAGTLGIGGEVGYRPFAMFGARIDGEAFSFSDTINAGHINYDASANLQSYGALADFYPFGQSFRLTGGLRLNQNELRGQSESVSVGGVTVPTSEFGSVGAKVTFDKFSPYVGVGWGGTITPGLNFTSDIGVMFNGNPKASLTASPNATGAALLASTGTNLNALTASERSSLQNAVNGYQYYPVIEIGLTYKF